MQRYRVYLGFLLWERLMASVAHAACSGRIWRDERQFSKRWGTSQTCWMACKFCCHSFAVPNKILHATDKSAASSPHIMSSTIERHDERACVGAILEKNLLQSVMKANGPLLSADGFGDVTKLRKAGFALVRHSCRHKTAYCCS